MSDHRRRRSLLSEPETYAFFSQVEDNSLLFSAPTYGHISQPSKPNSPARSPSTSLSSSSISNTVSIGCSQHAKDEVQCCVQHNYHDHANDEEVESNDPPIVTKGGVTTPFPLKLYRMLEHIDREEPELRKIVSWQPHGRCFLVHKQKQFAELVLPRFFQQKNTHPFKDN